jgi:hypothetical protein
MNGLGTRPGLRLRFVAMIPSAKSACTVRPGGSNHFAPLGSQQDPSGLELIQLRFIAIRRAKEALAVHPVVLERTLT